MKLDPVPGLGRAFRQRRVVGFFWLCRVLSVWIIAAPIAALLSGQGVGRYPEGDALLFQPGGLYLAESVRLALPELTETLRMSIISAGFLGYVLLLPLGGLCASLASDSPTSVGWSLARGLERLPKLTLLAGLTLFCQGVVAAGGAFLLGRLEARVAAAGWSERSQDLCLLAGVVLLVLCLVSIGAMQDVARSALATGQRSLLASIGAALRALRRFPSELVIAWLISVVWSWVLIALVAILVGRLNVGSGKFSAILAVALLHQGVAIVLVLLRAAWLGRAFELTVASGPEQS
jgi:hypothetical protein